VRAFLTELVAMIDRVRAVSIVLIVAGAVILAALLAGNPGIWIGDGGWIILVGFTVSAAYQVYENRGRAGRPDASTWGLATAGGLVLAFAAFGTASLLLRPLVTSTPVLADNAVALAVVAWVLLGAGVVTWQRGAQGRAIAAAMALAIGTVLGSVAALRTGAIWEPVAIVVLLLGLGIFVAAGSAGWQQWNRGRGPGSLERASAVSSPATRAGRQTQQPSKRARRNRRRQGSRDPSGPR
jgi:hypothetical protein